MPDVTSDEREEQTPMLPDQPLAASLPKKDFEEAQHAQQGLPVEQQPDFSSTMQQEEGLLEPPPSPPGQASALLLCCQTNSPSQWSLFDLAPMVAKILHSFIHL